MSTKSWSSRRLVFLAIMAALCVVGRYATSPLPNIQPVTAFLMVITLQIGLVDGLIVATLSVLVSNLFLGMGPWTIHQIISYSLLLLLLSLLTPLYRKMSNRASVRLILFAVIAGAFGFLYGFLISFFSVLTYSSLNTFWAYWLQGLPFDALHAFGNVIFYLVLDPLFRRLLKSF